MKITPLDIRRKEFRRSMRGYSDEEVDIFLDEVADEFERLFQENMEMQDRAQRLDEQIAGHAQMRDALEKTLVSAQLQSEEIRANAHKESELILRDAQLKARGIVNESYGEAQKAQQTLVQLKRLEEEFRFKFRSLLEGYLKLLDDAAVASTETSLATGGQAQTVEAPKVEVLSAAPQAPSARAIASEARANTGEAQAVASEGSSFARAPQAAAVNDEDIPTEETEAPLLEARPVAESYIAEQIKKAAGDATADVTAEPVSNRPVPSPGEPVDDASIRGFFFGRQLDDVDDTFPGEDGTNKHKGRDFEW